MHLVEPISFKLLHLGKAYLALLSGRLGHLEINRYYYALALIYRNDGQLTQKALATHLGKDKSLIVNIINALADKGYVYRGVNPADRREHLLKVTDKTKKELPEIMEAFARVNSDITVDISAEDMKIFETVLEKMEMNLKPYNVKEINYSTRSTKHITT